MTLPKTIDKSTLMEALSDKADPYISTLAVEIRVRFKKSVCKNLFGMSSEKVQTKLWKNSKSV